MAKIDSRLLDLPSSGKIVYVVQNGTFTPANIVDMNGIWTPSINDEDIVLTVDKDMTPYQLTGTNTEVNV